MNVPKTTVLLAPAVFVAAALSTAAAEPRETNVTIRILATAAGVGEIEHCGCKTNKKGGLPRRSTFVDSLRTENPATLLVEAGDFADTTAAGAAKNALIVESMIGMGYDAVSFGERELRVGWKVLSGMLPPDGPSLLAANAPFGERLRVVELGGVRVGIFGLLSPDVVRRSGANGLALGEPLETARGVVGELREAGAEIVVLLSQLDLAESEALIEAVPEIDVAVLGHAAGMRSRHGLVGQTITIRPGRRGQYVGVLDLDVDPAGEVVFFDGSTAALDEVIPEDPKLRDAVDRVKVQVQKLHDQLGVQSGS